MQNISRLRAAFYATSQVACSVFCLPSGCVQRFLSFQGPKTTESAARKRGMNRKYHSQCQEPRHREAAAPENRAPFRIRTRRLTPSIVRAETSPATLNGMGCRISRGCARRFPPLRRLRAAFFVSPQIACSVFCHSKGPKRQKALHASEEWTGSTTLNAKNPDIEKLRHWKTAAQWESPNARDTEGHPNTTRCNTKKSERKNPCKHKKDPAPQWRRVLDHSWSG